MHSQCLCECICMVRTMDSCLRLPGGYLQFAMLMRMHKCCECICRFIRAFGHWHSQCLCIRDASIGTAMVSQCYANASSANSTCSAAIWQRTQRQPVIVSGASISICIRNVYEYARIQASLNSQCLCECRG